MGTAPKAPKAEASLPGIKLGDVVLERYRVVEQIASGGHSVVFRGQDERLNRPVCIKVFSGLGGQSGVGRTSYEHFVQEAFALSRLTHPNTLRIYDFGHLGPKDADGMPLQVCEFMNGGTLSQVVREHGTQSVVETVRIITAMCAALAEAHGLGIVHRDIKPQNILFGAVGTNKLPKLADFGIAKWSDDAGEGEGHRRAEDTAIVAGQKLAMYSPSWAAPEQLAGQPVNATTDIYSLAAVAVYMLSGKAIFADEDVYAGYKKRRHADELVRDALRPLDVSDAMIELLAKALAFDPKKRIKEVDTLASELAVALEPSTDEQPRLRPRHSDETVPLEQLTPASLHSAITPPPAAPPLPPPPRAPKKSARMAEQAAPPALAYPTTTRAQLDADGISHIPIPGAQPPESEPVLPQPQPPPQAAPPQNAYSPSHPAAANAPGYLPPPTLRPPWMALAPVPQGPPRRLPLYDLPQLVADRRVHFIHSPNLVADLIGGQASKVRVTFLQGPGGARQLHMKGMTCFVALLGGRPSPAVQIDHAADIALVTPRAQEIGHIRVATGAPAVGQVVFPIGTELVAIFTDDCTDPILFDFGPGSEAYFVYTRGRPIPKSPRR